MCKFVSENTPYILVILQFGDLKNCFISKWFCKEHHRVIAGPLRCCAVVFAHCHTIYCHSQVAFEMDMSKTELLVCLQL